MEVISVTSSALDLFDRHRVFQSPHGARRWQAGEQISLLRSARIEPYVHVCAGHALPAALGAFSYSHSPFRLHVEVGRYCSIGRGVTWLTGDHPTEWVTTSPIAHDTNLAAHAAYFRDNAVVPQPKAFSQNPHRT